MSANRGTTDHSALTQQDKGYHPPQHSFVHRWPAHLTQTNKSTYYTINDTDTHMHIKP